jgi:hypothetical protein
VRASSTAVTYTATAAWLALHKTCVQIPHPRPKSRLVDASTIAALTWTLHCEPANILAMRYVGLWPRNARGERPAGIQGDTGSRCALITLTTERRTHVR